MNRRDFTKTVLGAVVAGMIAGSDALAQEEHKAPAHKSSKKHHAGGAESKAHPHECKGKNECKGQGGCKTGDGGCKGKNSCKGKGGCAVKASTTEKHAGGGEAKATPHECKGKNECKGQGGCKTGDAGCKGKNSCKGKGGCAVKASTGTKKAPAKKTE